MIHSCPNCGGKILGDGFRTVMHCENVDLNLTDKDTTPDADTIFCDDLTNLYTG